VYDVQPCGNVRNYATRTFVNSTESLDDNVASIRNRSGYVYELYDRTRYRSPLMEIFSRDYADLGSAANQASSHQCIGS